MLDSRPFDEYRRVSIPTAANVPGAELVLRVRDMAPSPDTLVVVNCAGRTRSIIGAQSLINAGVPNKVVALRNGTMGFTLAGFSCDSGKGNRRAAISNESLAWAKDAAARVAQRYGIERIDRGHTRSLVAHDENAHALSFSMCAIRKNISSGHIFGAISAPGGQLVQATDLYAGTLGARIVLVDDDERTRGDDRVLAQADGLEGRIRLSTWARRRARITGASIELLGPAPPPESAISCQELAKLHARNEATVIDLSLSPNYRKGAHPRRLVRHPLAAGTGAAKDHRCAAKSC